MLPCAPVLDALEHLDAVDACATDRLFALVARARERGLEACLAPALAARGLGLELAPPDAAPPPMPEKATRDAYGTGSSAASENFILRWGSGVSDEQASRALEAFETAWQVLITEGSYPIPSSANSYKLNVYVGDSGENTPSIENAAGYYWRDVGPEADEAWIVVTATAERGVPDSAPSWRYRVGSDTSENAEDGEDSGLSWTSPGSPSGLCGTGTAGLWLLASPLAAARRRAVRDLDPTPPQWTTRGR